MIAQDLKATALHGGRSQSEREAALRDFRKGTTNILVATDVASRGLDVTGTNSLIAPVFMQHGLGVVTCIFFPSKIRHILSHELNAFRRIVFT